MSEHFKTARFATAREALEEPFRSLGEVFCALNREFDLPDHHDLNAEHFPWAAPLLTRPQLYGSRLWEYPFAVLAAELQAGMSCADVGCGRTPFTVYLARRAACRVTGFDPDHFGEAARADAFGVNRDFVRRTGLEVRASGMGHLDAPDASFERVFCLSVIEHVEEKTARAGMREMARILKPGGRLVVTVDIGMFDTLSEVDPLSLAWESGLVPAGRVSLTWPRKRFGVGFKGGRPIDVYGLVLDKSTEAVEAAYAGEDAVDAVPQTYPHLLSALRRPKWRERLPTPWYRRLRPAWETFRWGERERPG